MAEQNLIENLEKIVAILDVLLYRIRKLRRACEKDATLEADAIELIFKSVDGIISMIELERNHFEDGTQTVPADYPEDRAVGYAEYILQMGRQTLSKAPGIPECNRERVLEVFASVEKLIADLKKERGLEDVLITQKDEMVEGPVRFSVKDLEIPDEPPTYEECVGKIAQIEWLINHYEGEGYAVQYLEGLLPKWKKQRDASKP
ncbi:hypothetical protein SAMN04487864_10536 [Succiniclasticum ruminis]|uniref:Uncharacterized protein n=1 Tax=Succiniclasticum ruminis TaxID=40841 RepID=A0A1G6KPR0_9FIRM|nr:hypothetical protein [Succiniclasticum ruminis]SDC33102.1 hypothetical protein SAMN04487864_10536 [Succiniclasticum ruminis]